MTAQPHCAVLFRPASATYVVAPPIVEVRLNGRPEPRLRLDTIEQRLGGAPTATFAAGLGRDLATDETVRLEDLAARIRPGTAITATLLRGGVLSGADAPDLVVFEGRIVRVDMALEADGERLVLKAEDPAADLLRRRVGGQRARTDDDSVARIEGRPLVFNPDGRPNASGEPYDPGAGEPYTVFAPEQPAGAAAWTLDEAVAYLLAEHAASDEVETPSPSEIRAAVAATVIRDVSLEGRSLAEALDALLELDGAQIIARVEPGPGAVSRRLEIWSPARAPAAWLCHQPPGQAYDPDRTDFRSATVRMDFAAAPRRYVAAGDRKFYESTFDLVPGWDDALATYDPDDVSPRSNADFDTVRDVFRKWVLNEAGDYTASPYSRGPAADLSAVFEAAPYVRRRRRFLPCLSRDGLGRSRGVYVEVSCDAGESWEQATLAARVLRDECGFYLTEDPLPPDYLEAAMRDEVRVRVTATIESDAALTAEVDDADAPALPGRTRHLAVPAGYRFRRVAPTSRFYGSGDADEADDTTRLEDLVRAAWEADRRAPAPAHVAMPYLAMGHRVGECLRGTRGRRLDLARQHTGYVVAPVVQCVRFTFAPMPGTELDLK